MYSYFVETYHILTYIVSVNAHTRPRAHTHTHPAVSLRGDLLCCPLFREFLVFWSSAVESVTYQLVPVGILCVPDL